MMYCPPRSRRNFKLASLTKPRSMTHTRDSEPCFRSIAAMIVWTVVESCLLPAKTSYPSG